LRLGFFEGWAQASAGLGFGAQVAVDWLLRMPEQMPPKIRPLNCRDATINILE
jgi:hypothetical protein